MPGAFFLAFALLAAYVTAHACIQGVHGSRVSGPVAAMDGLEHVVPVEAVAVGEAVAAGEAVAVCSVQFCSSLVAVDGTLLYIQKAPRLPPSLLNPLSFPFSSATHLVLRLLLIPFFLPLFFPCPTSTFILNRPVADSLPFAGRFSAHSLFSLPSSCLADKTSILCPASLRLIPSVQFTSAPRAISDSSQDFI